MEKVSLVKMTRQVTNRVDLAKAIIEIFTSFNKIKISDTQITVLAYFMVYGVNLQTKKLIVKIGICKNINTVKIAMVKLKKLELIYKDDFDSRVKVTDALNIQLTTAVGVYIKIDNK